MVTEDYVSFEVAKLLKEKGFNCACISYYEYFSSSITLYSGMVIEWSDSYTNHNENPDKFSRPTLQMAMKWLRKIHKLHIQILNPTVDEEAMEFNEEYVVGITNLSNYLFETPFDYVKFTSYEEAVEAAIKYCLENLI